MSRISDRSIDEVREAVDMLDLVGTATQVKRTGASYMGRCPFHEERSASFSVDPVKKLYHCFGCQRGGDHVKFVQETQSLDFVGAIEWLAERFGVTLEYEESSPADARRRDERRRLFALLDGAAAYYSRYLWDSKEARAARAYLSERGISNETAQTFRVGYARPPGTGCARPPPGRVSRRSSWSGPAWRSRAGAGRLTGSGSG